MFDIMSQAQNAIASYNAALTISSANIANMNVPGYKKIGASFQSVFERVLSQGSAAEGNLGGTNPRQLGSGAALAGVSVDFSNGDLSDGTQLDLAISGQGMFILSANGGASFNYSRAGNFEVDSNGNLTSNGMLVYGFNSSGALVPISGLPSGIKANYRWLPDGTLEYTTDLTTDPVNYTPTGYQIALTYFTNPSGLAQGQGTTFTETLASGRAATAQPVDSIIGTLKPGKIEQSNVFYLGESINVLGLQRAVSGNLTMIRMASDMISNFIQKLG